ncbi:MULTISPECIES: porin [Halomonadaceae]|uniref:porin n=1 Tax=Halomonadaceae TaxID=28256 RepID=UPI0015835A43|nr:MULTISPECIES: porin [Halomonas]MDI4637939.1 porin [Halomonas sp. BMC7]NUJ58942.1 porin [Halomonas taeanensis]
MKKTLLATAIAGAMVVSASASAATVYNQDGTKLDIYGNIQMVYASVKDANGDSRDQIGDNGTTFGFAAEHAITSDVTGYLKLEFDDIQADEMKTDIDDDESGDQAYVGVKGSFGDVRLGSYDQLIDDWIQDPITNNEYFDVSDSTTEGGVGSARETDKVTYTSPSFGGLQFAVGSQYKGDAEDENLSDSGEASFFGGAKYTVGAFSLAAVYDNLDTFDVTTTPETDFGDQYGVTAQYTVGSLRLSAKYEQFEDGSAAEDDIDFAALGARYGYGMGDVYGAVQEVSYDASNVDDRTEVVVGGTYNISSAMYTYIEVASDDRENDEGDGVATGITYLF